MEKLKKKTYELQKGLNIFYAELNELEYQYIKYHIEKKVDNDMMIITTNNEKIKSSEVFRIEEVRENTFKLNMDHNGEVMVQAMCSIITMKNIIQQKNAIMDTEGYYLDDIEIIENLFQENKIKYKIITDIIELDMFAA